MATSPYGYCPVCGSWGRDRENSPSGTDTCSRGHSYPTKDALSFSQRMLRFDRQFVGVQTFRSQPTIEKAPTSCRCGGDTAFVGRAGVLTIMLGCVCHHEVEVSPVLSQDNTETGKWEVAVYYHPEGVDEV